MKKQFGFILFDDIKEFESWIFDEKVTRKITRLQVHHMSLPNYNTWITTDKRLFGDNRELSRTKSLDDYGKSKWHYRANCNHFIAQHFNIFPNGKITTGRSLNSTPIGIRGFNENAICVEIYGNFDKGHDKMTTEQKEAVMHVDDETFGEKEVIEVFRKGYKIKDKVIRHAMVKVAN